MTDSTASETRCPRWLKILLGLSLALNFVIAGVVAGLMLRGGPPREGPSGMGYAAPYVIALPRDVRRDVFGAIRADESLPKRSARRARYADMIEALRAEPFDRDRVQAILRRQGSEVGRIQDASQAAWLSAVTEMDAAERSAYVARIEEVLERGRRGKTGDRN
ncbi:periplasmic heavy metal sensor [Tateyamaria pelophila]|uniref:periplasmic heavy metal sensor n=1 Tax=Tateyamaria pelophila TaxID=328415 RepID=UPI001CBDC6CA|nr:periplasmic heavy metal sensor [Tateyamaria pelophila]